MEPEYLFRSMPAPPVIRRESVAQLLSNFFSISR